MPATIRSRPAWRQRRIAHQSRQEDAQRRADAAADGKAAEEHASGRSGRDGPLPPAEVIAVRSGGPILPKMRY